MRYDTMDAEGETRRQRNERFKKISPLVEIPEGGAYLMRAFWELSALRSQGFNGPDSIRPDTIMDWCRLTGNVYCREELTVLMRMDATYVASMHNEVVKESADKGKT